jgi:hypothetical protein
MNNKSDEEKRAISKKRSQTLLNRSEEEKQACINKIKKTRSEWSNEKRKQISKKYSDGLKQHYLNNPNHKLEHSKRMSGKNNPSYGKKWMNNGINRVYIKSDEIQKYLDLGYKFGAKLN